MMIARVIENSCRPRWKSLLSYVTPVCAPRELCDIGDIGKLTREQFALALHLINQKLTKGLDPPQSLSPEMIPPSDRQNIKQVSQVPE